METLVAAASENGFPDVSEEFLSRGLTQTLKALKDEGTPRRMAEHYDVTTKNVGHSFLSLESNDPERITATDLFAVRLLSVSTPANMVRRILDTEELSTNISDKLGVLPAVRLEDTTPTDFYKMAEFYIAMRTGLTGNKNSRMLATPSKLVARKRPDLFPIRDSLVCAYLGRKKQRDYREDWLLFRHIMRDK